MKICHVVWGFEVGGIETMLVNIANYQASHGHDVHIMIVDKVISPKLVDTLVPAITLHEVGRKPLAKSPIALLRMNFIMLGLKPDIVHFHHPKLHRFILPFLRKHSCTTCHGMALDENLPYYKGADNLFSISEGVREDILRRAGVDSIVVTNGIPTGKYAVRAFGMPNDRPFRILQLGRILFSAKGQDLLVDAAVKLARLGLWFTLDFIGDGPDKSNLQQMVNRNGLNDRVNFLGMKSPDYVCRHLADYDLLVQPSRHEGFGLSVAESMVARVPVLVSDLTPQLEVIDHGRFGYSFATENVDSLADAVERIMNHPENDSMLMAAQRYAMANYDVSRTAEEYLHYYCKILEQ